MKTQGTSSGSTCAERVLTEIWGVERAESVGIYRQRARETGESLGSWNDTLRPHGTSASIVYGNGSPCQRYPGQRMSSIISFECAHDVWHTGNPVFAGSIDGCQYFFTWRTSFACASSVQKSLWHSAGMVMASGFAILLVYFVLYVSYRRFHPNLHGQDRVSTRMLCPDWNSAILTVRDKIAALVSTVFRSQERARQVNGNEDSWSPASARAWWEQNHNYSTYASTRSPRTSHDATHRPSGSDFGVRLVDAFKFSEDRNDLGHGFTLGQTGEDWDGDYSPPTVDSRALESIEPMVPVITRTDVDDKTQEVNC